MADASTWRTFGEVVTDTATSRKAHPAVLLPDDPTIRALATESRPLMVELRAKPYLDKLDGAPVLDSSADRGPSRVPSSDAKRLTNFEAAYSPDGS
ncbi:MAG: hypothetical protein ABIW50_01895 [Candidatus Limnocylindria bacterium]